MVQRLAILGLIAFCIGMQVRVYFVPHPAYPFIEYRMYSYSRQPPVRTTETFMYARLPDGGRVEVTPAYMGLKRYAWFVYLARPLWRELPPAEVDRRALIAKRLEAGRRITDQVELREGVTPTHVEFTVHQYRIEGRDILTGIDGRRIALPLTEARASQPEVLQ